MSSHSSAQADSRSLCEELVRELASLQPGIIRSEKEGACGCRKGANSRFAYIYHFKRSPKIRVYFRRPADIPLKSAPSEISIEERPKISSPWEKTFPAYFFLSDSANLPSAARFLIDVAYPLSVSDSSIFQDMQARPSECLAEEVISTAKHTEGAIQRILVNRYERNSKARQACIDHYGENCCVCGFDFGDIYGPSLEGFIHVHHLQSLASVGERYEVDPIQDLRPICPNCHAVAHRTEPALSLEQIKLLLRRSPI